MSAFVIRDVTDYYEKNSHRSKNSYKTQSTITPFQTVLEKEENKSVETDSDKVQRSTPDKVHSTTKDSESASADLSGSKVSLPAIFEAASKKYDISYDFLVAVAKAESDFNTKCVSSAGAKGIMQLMPYECEEFGVDNPYDAKQNIMAAAKLLKAHLEKFDGDYILAAAAYNAGSGAVKKYGGVPPYSETQNYVKKIKKFMKEGVTVPDKKVRVASSEKKKDSAKSTKASEASVKAADSSAAENKEIDEGEAATEDDLEKITVSVGTGDSSVTMTYGAYLKYLELGTTGVG